MLLGKYKLESDELNATLYERHKSKKTGQDYWTPHSYFSSVENALKGLITMKINQSGLRDLKTVQVEIDKLFKMVEKIAPEPVTRKPTIHKEAVKE